MLKGRKVKLLKDNIFNDAFLDIIDNNPSLINKELTVENCIPVYNEGNKKYFDIEVTEIPGFNIYFDEYIMVD